MKQLNNTELMTIKGGFSIAILLGIGGAITFVIGVVDGFIRPLKCNK